MILSPVSSSPRDFDCSEPTKKCKHCDINEFRSELIITKTKKLRQSNEDLNNKITLINSKAQRLWTVLTSIIKSAVSICVYRNRFVCIIPAEQYGVL
ncbi:hypothetical protein O3G_MSEX000799 [Manduca sexta]|nr:hypothetical protein O3G_MSEX000799 [Manduca sexta]